MKKPSSFMMCLTQRYRVYYCSHGGGWYVAYDDCGRRQRRALYANTRPEAEEAVIKLDERLNPKESAPVETRQVTWQELYKMFLTYKEGRGLAPRSLERYRASFEAFGRYLTTLTLNRADQVTLLVLEASQLIV